MNHQEVTNGMLVERYLLNEMAETERIAFEEHYFSCAVCAEEVASAAKFVDNARRPLHQLDGGAAPAAIPAVKWWDRWLALAPKPALAGACACLALALGLKSLPAGPVAEVTGSYFVTETRAAGSGLRKISPGPRQSRVALLFNHTDPSVAQFRFVLESSEGRIVRQFEGDAPRDTNDIQVMVPVSGLRSGVYTLRVKNAASQADISALSFELAMP
jgi:hypothetical protein